MLKNKDIKIEINNTADNLEVCVCLKHFDPRSTPAMAVATSHVKAHLESENIEYGKIIQESHLNNTPPDPLLEGTWVFAKKVKTKSKTTKSKPRTTKNTRGIG